jgi:hypothetical protein
MWVGDIYSVKTGNSTPASLSGDLIVAAFVRTNEIDFVDMPRGGMDN